MNKIKSNLSLDDLSDPKSYQGDLTIKNEDVPRLINIYYSMIKIRLVEQKLAEARKSGEIGGPVHLGVGQEAIAVGVSTHLRATDRVFGAHRSHSHILALGSDVYKLFAEVLGKDCGHSKGMGGSMHLWDEPNGFYGSVPIVAGTVPLAVGASLAAKMQDTGDVAVAYLGDGAVEEGIFHESLNLARILNVPVIFVVENNLFASHMHISLRQPNEATARFAHANHIPYKIVDGNDVLSVENAAHEMVCNARSGYGPGFIEAVTYRWYGHVDWREDIDVGVNRSLDDVLDWRKRDPIRRLRGGLINSGLFKEEKEKSFISSFRMNLDELWKQAQLAPYPSIDNLLKHVYADENLK